VYISIKLPRGIGAHPLNDIRTSHPEIASLIVCDYSDVVIEECRRIFLVGSIVGKSARRPIQPVEASSRTDPEGATPILKNRPDVPTPEAAWVSRVVFKVLDAVRRPVERREDPAPGTDCTRPDYAVASLMDSIDRIVC